QIENHTRAVLEREIGGELDWRRIALTEDQVNDKQYRLKQLIIRKADRRYRPVRYHDAVECEALKQARLMQIVRDELDTLLLEIGGEPLEDVLERERRQRERMRRVLNGRRR